MLNKNKDVQKLQKKLKLYQFDIENSPDNATAYYMAGCTLIQLAELTGNANQISQALEYYNNAVRLSESREALYLAARGELYARLGAQEEAIVDVVAALKLPTEEGSIARHVEYTLKVIVSRAKEKIEQLKNSGKISEELADQLLGLANESIKQNALPNVTGLNVNIDGFLALWTKVQNIEQTLNEHKEVLVEYREKLDTLGDKLETLQDVTKKLRGVIDTNKNISDKDKAIMQGRLDNISTRIDSLADKEVVEQLTEEMRNLIIEGRVTKGRLVDLEEEIDGMVIKFAEHEQKLGEHKEILDEHDNIITQLQKQVGIINSLIPAMQEKIDSGEITNRKQLNKVNEAIRFLTNAASNEALMSNPVIQTILENIKDLNIDSGLTKNMILDISNIVDEMVDEKMINTVKVTYDNPLLNHPVLLKEAIETLGYDKAVDLSSKLGASLVQQAIDEHDSSVILAGMVSAELMDEFYVA